ncbi:MAG: glycosyltransferase family 4 protein [Halioglobus sp.]
MQIAFTIYHIQRYGGQQRHLHRFVEELLRRGHHCRVYAASSEWGALEDVDMRHVPVRAMRQHRFEQRFHAWVTQDLLNDPVDCVIGFNKMPGLDFYFCYDSCYLDTVMRERSALYRRSARYAHYVSWERAVFAPPSQTQLLMHSSRTAQVFVQNYGTEASRIQILPPGASREHAPGSNAPDRRKTAREALSLDSRDLALLFIASSFQDKGLERVLQAQAQMRKQQPNAETRLLVVGSDNPQPYRRLAKRLGILDAVSFLGPREDVPDLLQAADVMVHPAVSDAQGSVLLESLVAGLPVLTTSASGYADHIAAANAGIVLRDPFSLREMTDGLMRFVDGVFRAQCAERSLRYAADNDLYSMYVVGTDFLLATLQDKLGNYGR